MESILNYLIVLIILAVMRTALPRVKAVKSILISRTVAYMERKIQGSRRGAEKKAKAIRILKWLGVKADETTSTMIDLAVDTMNAKNGVTTASLKETVASELTTGVDTAGKSLKNILSKEKGEK